MVEAVTAVWGVVQEKWMQLESIFIGSEDIRAQLPEDSKRFDIIDQDWRELMGEIQFVPNALEACTRDGVLEKLDKMQELLEQCATSGEMRAKVQQMGALVMGVGIKGFQGGDVDEAHL